VDRAQALLHIATVTASGGPLDDVLDAACAGSIAALDAIHASVALSSDDLRSVVVRRAAPDLVPTGREHTLVGIPLADELVATRQAVFIADVERDARLGSWREHLQALRVGACLFAPLVSAGRLLGWFRIDWAAAPLLNAADIDFCRTLASHVALAIVNANLEAEAIARDERLDSLHQAMLHFAFVLGRDPSELLETIAVRAVQLLKARRGGIYEYDESSRVLTLQADTKETSLKGTTLRVGEGVAGRLIETGEPYRIVPDYRLLSERARVFNVDTFEAVLEATLRWRDRVIGVVYVEREAGRPFAPSEAQLLLVFADQAAIALAQSVVSREGPELQEQLSLRHITREVVGAGSTPLDVVLANLVSTAAEKTRAEVCQLLLATSANLLTLEASRGERKGTFRKGKPLKIRRGPRKGLLSHTWLQGEVFTAHGPALRSHEAVQGIEPDRLPSGKCHSLMVVPLRSPDSHNLIGLLWFDNKKGPDERPSDEIGFSTVDKETALQLAALAVGAVEHERALDALREETEQTRRQKEHLSHLTEQMRLLRHEETPEELERQLVRGAVELSGYEMGWLFEVEASVATPRALRFHSLLESNRGAFEETCQSRAHEASRARQPVVFEYPRRVTGAAAGVLSGRTIMAVPVPPDDAARYVLVVVSASGGGGFVSEIQDVLVRLAEHAGGLISFSAGLHWERRALERAAALRRLNEYILDTPSLEKALAAFLTGVTAKYGLAMNRAAVFAIDAAQRSLTGRIGIGQMTLGSANRVWDDWGKREEHNLDAYLARLDETGHLTTELDECVRGIRLPVDDPEVRAFLDRSREGPAVHRETPVPPEVPRVLIEELKLRAPFVVLPLVWRTVTVGYLVADNAWSQVLPTQEELVLLTQLATTAAFAIDTKDHPAALTQDQLEKLEEIQAAFERAQGAADLSAIQREVVVGAHRAFVGSSAIILWSYDEKTDQFNLVQAEGAIRHAEREEMQESPPGPDQSARTVKRLGWLDVPDVEREQRPFMTAGTRRMLLSARIRSYQAAALRVADEDLGVLYVNYDQPRQFSPNDKRLLLTFAERSALVLKKSQMFDQVVRTRDTARVVARLLRLEELDTTLEKLVTEAERVLRADAVTLYAYDSGADRLAYPPKMSPGVIHKSGVTRFATVAPDSVVRRLLSEHRARYVPDVSADEWFCDSPFVQRENVKSVVAIPLVAGQDKVGVMFVSFRQLHRFTNDDKENIALLSDLGAAAIRNAQLLAGMEASFAVAVAGLASSEIGHEIGRMRAILDGGIESLISEIDALRRAGTTDAGRKRLEHVSSDLYVLRAAIPDTERMVNPGAPSENLQYLCISELLKSFHADIQRRADISGVVLSLETSIEDHLCVLANRTWMLKAFSHLERNATRAMSNCGSLTISAHRRGSFVDIEFADTGPGIPRELREGRLSQWPLSNRTSRSGMGVGLTIVRMVTRCYAGSLSFPTIPGHTGAVVRLSFPVASPPVAVVSENPGPALDPSSQ
jgi:GAF domain-containing protein